MKNFDTVIFDLDGTLLDTLDDLAGSVNNALEKYGFPCRTRDEVRRFVGNGVERLVTLCVPGGAANEKYQDCLADFKRHYSENMRNRTAPYDGIPALLRRLKAEGFKRAVVSNKFDAAVKALCRDYFGEDIELAIGESKETARKPAPDTALKALRELGSVPARTVYVGDSEVDAETARNAGLVFIGVTWGFRDRELLEQKGADFVIDRPEELFQILRLP
ncbi:phosphoglycolate phosphatase [Sporobacter termitidis DSM 10068]|uniref:Phosphoglycolate phosphatase n=1 Tax=Sporobacter termitidis DSM 10068 TaxID=1123282 RepID=A0A1M5TNC0_9FIRM|nr:HAD-IA family hydrolase [Sporobacter termitidis]SHH52277.1 phosphoglycolate phosphatase [Sporobacter termitidis DSM 10068]